MSPPPRPLSPRPRGAGCGLGRTHSRRDGRTESSLARPRGPVPVLLLLLLLLLLHPALPAPAPAMAPTLLLLGERLAPRCAALHCMGTAWALHGHCTAMAWVWGLGGGAEHGHCKPTAWALHGHCAGHCMGTAPSSAWTVHGCSSACDVDPALGTALTPRVRALHGHCSADGMKPALGTALTLRGWAWHRSSRAHCTGTAWAQRGRARTLQGVSTAWVQQWVRRGAAEQCTAHCTA